MFEEFLSPVSFELRELAGSLDQFSIGHSLRFDEELEEKAIVILGIKDYRGSGEEVYTDFDGIRAQFYQLKRGSWHLPIYDLGDIEAGATVEDTYFAFLKVQQELLKSKCQLILLGGSADLIYWQFRAFDSVRHQVNLSLIDNRFRLGNDALELSNQNYLSKIITQEPHTLFDFTQMGIQTYFVGQEELDLMETLNFEVKRLGKLIETLSESEPELRNSDLVAMNLESIQVADFQSSLRVSPNGFSAREICSLARYAGINNKVQSFGVYNYKAKNILPDDLLLAEILWYFIEGKNYAREEIDFEKEGSYETYYVQLPERSLIFYHDVPSQQWWMELNELEEREELGQQIIPCSAKDYEFSLKGKIPDRWWKSYKKLF